MAADEQRRWRAAGVPPVPSAQGLLRGGGWAGGMHDPRVIASAPFPWGGEGEFLHLLHIILTQATPKNLCYLFKITIFYLRMRQFFKRRIQLLYL